MKNKKTPGKKNQIKEPPLENIIFDKQNIRLLCIFGILLCIAVSFVLFPALDAKAKMFDDHQYVFNNQLVKSPSIESGIRFLTEILRPSTVGGYYQPLSMISLMCDYWMSGNDDNNFMVFHRTSLILHILNTCLLMILLFVIFRKPIAAFITALIFGIHPMTVETIAWLGERKTTLAAFFALFCLIFYVMYTKRRTRNLYEASAIMYILALMAKPTTTMLPIAFLLLDYWPLKRTDYKKFTALLSEKIPFFIITFISAIITFLSQKFTAGAVAPSENYPFSQTIWRICYNIVFYPLKMLWPKNLSSFYVIPDPLSLENPQILYSVIGTIALFILLALSFKKTKAFVVGSAIFYSLIFPTMGLIGFTIVIASDKYAYLPSFGMLLIVAKLLGYITDNFSKVNWTGLSSYLKTAQILAIVCLLAIFSGEYSISRNYLTYWQDTEKLYNYMISLAPNGSQLYGNLGAEIQVRGRIDEAMDCYRKAIQLNPNYLEATVNLGTLLGVKNKDKESLKYFYRALEINPNYLETYRRMIIVLIKEKEFDTALNFCNKELSLNPNLAEPYIQMASIYGKQGDATNALKCYKEILKLHPTGEIADTIRSEAKKYNCDLEGITE